MDLEGNPSPLDVWTTYDLSYLDEDGKERQMTLPVTIADWAMGEARFRRHYTKTNPDDSLVPFHEYIDMDEDEREGETAFIYTVDAKRHLSKIAVSEEIVELAEERLRHWAQLKEMAGIDVSDNMRDAVAETMTDELESRLTALRSEYEAKIAQLKTQYPLLIARRLAEGLLKGNADKTVAQLLEKAENWGGPVLDAPADFSIPSPATPAPATAAPAASAAAASAAPAAAVAEEEEALGNEPYIDTLRCTSCDDCLKVNPKVFVYNDDQQAEIGDARAGSFKQIVMAAEACPAECIHPGDPLNPKEKGLDKLIKRAEPFN
jgi:pyruvate-ferredoxin/flavodoxin oxidoreductase